MLHHRTLLLAALVLAAPCNPQGWPSTSGNPQRNAQSAAYGPLSARKAWAVPEISRIGWTPFIDGQRVFIVRQDCFLPCTEPNDSPIFCYDLQTGAQLWRVDLPFNPGEWTTWLLGTSNGLVYASRSGNGSAGFAAIYALDQSTGAVRWTSQEQINANAYDGVVFAPDGDLIVSGSAALRRVRWEDGTTRWSASRFGCSSGSCGAAVFGNAVYVGASNVIRRHDLATGAFQYQSPPMLGGSAQNTLMVGPDGTVYFHRGWVPSEFSVLYAFADTGSRFLNKWQHPCAYAPFAEFAVGPNGWVYMLQDGDLLTALDGDTGAMRAIHLQPLGYSQTRFAVDADGRVFVNDAAFPTAQLYSFEPDLTLRWTHPMRSGNIGGPALAADGTLVVADADSVRAFRTPGPWTDVGGGIPGVNGNATLRGLGTMTCGNDVVLSLRNARQGALSTLVMGSSSVQLPLLGGTLVPSPDLVVPGLPIGFGGHVDLTFTWPCGVGAGTGFWFQHWYPDAAAIRGVAASNGLRGVTPGSGVGGSQVTVQLEPVKDNTLYQEPTGPRSNGAGTLCFSGSDVIGRRRRALMAFDVAGAVPAGSTIVHVQLRLTVAQAGFGSRLTGLHRVLRDWGEAGSVASGSQSTGVSPARGDATWAQAFWPEQPWAAPGGDFVSMASAVASVHQPGTLPVWTSTSQLVADVQGWLDDPMTNFGWLVRGDEFSTFTDRAFYTREASESWMRPALAITYESP